MARARPVSQAERDAGAPAGNVASSGGSPVITIEGLPENQAVLLDKTFDGASGPGAGAVRYGGGSCGVNTTDPAYTGFADKFIPFMRVKLESEAYQNNPANSSFIKLFQEMTASTRPGDGEAAVIAVQPATVFDLSDRESLTEIPYPAVEAYYLFQREIAGNPVFADNTSLKALAFDASRAEGLISAFDLLALDNGKLAEEILEHFRTETFMTRLELATFDGRGVEASVFVDKVTGFADIRLTDENEIESDIISTATGLAAKTEGLLAPSDLPAILAAVVKAIAPDDPGAAGLIVAQMSGPD